MFGEKLYTILPLWAQELAVTAYGYRLCRRRYGTYYHEYKKALPKIYALTYEQVSELQMESLRQFIGYAKDKSPFYTRLYEHIEPTRLRNLSDLKYLPVVDKEQLRQNLENIYTVTKYNSSQGHTGGTTGKSLVVRYTRRDGQIRMAELDFFREQFGVRHGMKRASFSGKVVVPSQNVGSDIFWRNNRALNQRFYSSFHLNIKNVDKYIYDINKYQPQIMDGFANCIADLCRYAKLRGYNFSFRPIAVFPVSEPLYENERSIIREMLGTEPRNQYASSEGAPFIFECMRGNLHYAMHTGIIEADENGDALVTSFTTHGTPLIRYKIGDRIIFSNRSCDCGWDTPLVDMVEGRTNDYLLSAQKVKVYAVNFANAVKNFPNTIIQTQYRQVELNKVTVFVVVDKARFNAESGKKIIVDEVKKRLGGEVDVQVQIVDEIPRTKSGKVRFIVNEVTDQGVIN